MLDSLWKRFMRPPQAERRRLVREPLRAPALVELGGREVPCTTIDLSKSGAKLEFPRSAMLPERFRLQVPCRRLKKDVRLVWRKGDQLGVEFLA